MTCKDIIVRNSPNYPENYDNDINIKWTAFVPDGSRILIQFVDFNTEASDVLTIRDPIDPRGDTTYWGPMGQDGVLPSFISQDKSVEVIFKSNDKAKRKGFNMTISCFNSTRKYITDCP